MIYIVETSEEHFGVLNSERKNVKCDTETLIKALNHPNITVWNVHYADEKLESVEKYEYLKL